MPPHQSGCCVQRQYRPSQMIARRYAMRGLVPPVTFTSVRIVDDTPPLRSDCGASATPVQSAALFRRGVAQPGRALRSGRRGRRFESCLPDQTLKTFSDRPALSRFCFFCRSHPNHADHPPAACTRRHGAVAADEVHRSCVMQRRFTARAGCTILQIRHRGATFDHERRPGSQLDNRLGKRPWAIRCCWCS